MKELEKKNQLFSFSYLVKIIIFAFLYYFSARICLNLATINVNASPFWAPTGIAFGILLLAGFEFWPAISLGAFLANLSIGSSLSVVIPITFGNTLEALVGFYLFKWAIQKQENFGIHTRSFAFIISSMLATIISATLGALSLCIAGVSLWKEFFPVFFTWWAGDAMGGLVFFPLIYYFSDKSLRVKFYKYALAIIFSFILSLIIIARPEGAPLLFFLFPLLFLCAFYTNETGTALAVASIVVSSVWAIKGGNGIFQHGSSNANLVNLQLFLGTISITGMFLIDFKKSSVLKSVGAILFGGWFFSGILFATFYKQANQLSNTQFNNLIEKLEVSIHSKMERNLTALQSGAGLFIAKKDISSNEWKRFCEQLKLDVAHDGLLGLGRISRIEKSSLKSHLEKYPEIHYHSLGENHNNEAYVIDLVEPKEKNSQALGLDIATEKKRREAANYSRDNALPAMTDTIQLVQIQKKKAGFLLYYPFYSADPTLRSVEERHSIFKGWTYAPVVLQDFFTAVFSQKDFQSLTYSVSNASDSEQTILAQSPNLKLIKGTTSRDRQIKIYNQIYNFKLSVSPGYLSSADTIASWVAVFATALTLILAAFIVNSLSLGKRAQELADKMTEELKRNQIKLALSAKMSSLGEMASGIAHEINNPLTIINSKVMVLSKLLEKDVIDLPKIQNSLKKIEETTDRIAKIIRGLSAFARNTENDPMEPAFISKIIEETLELSHERFKNYSIDLKVEIKHDSIINCRPHQISQVLLNLLGNAHDAISHLSEKWVSIEVEQDEHWVYINVTDSGPGIPDAVVERIMEPFFTTKEVGKGTGLGLSISKGIVEDHGGQLNYQTWQYHTRFIIKLPLLKGTS